MLKIFAALALACLVTPAVAAHHAAPPKPTPPAAASLPAGAMRCIPVDDAKSILGDNGATILGLFPIPFSHGQMLYWTDGPELFGAPVAPGADSGCLVIDEIIELGPYVPEAST